MGVIETTIWIIAGIVMLAIIIFLHKHFYYTKSVYNHEFGYYETVADLDHPLPFPLWLLLVMVILALIPIVNLMAFIFAFVMYPMVLSLLLEENVVFKIPAEDVPKWLKVLLKFLNRPV